MFDSALVIIDEMARPVLIIPEELPKGKAFLKIVEGGIDIGVNETTLGQIRDMDTASLALIGLQEAVGMATFKGAEGEEMPGKIQYVADVTETRFG
ncbi:MAG: hypothetical protein EBQ96_04670 [Proteobacteria bacterium]|nr:hypothetical protein [Pseudomonadota bacterium]